MSHGGTIKYAALEPFTSSSEQPTVHLRWCGGKLQQKWLITDLLDWCPVAQRDEWRDVPTDDTDAGFPTASTVTSPPTGLDALDKDPRNGG